MGEGNRVCIEPVKEGKKFRRGNPENVSEDRVKRKEQATICAKKDNMDKARKVQECRIPICMCTPADR